MNNSTNKLSNWILCTLEDVSEGENAIVDGPFGSNLKNSDYISDKVNGVPVLTTKNLEGDYSDDKVRFISKSKFETLRRSQVNPGDIIVAKIGSIGKNGIYPSGARTAIIPANLLKFSVSRQVHFQYVYFYINYYGLQKEIKAIASATAQPAFNVTKFRKLKIPLPPIAEQKRIVDKIEELFSELDKGIETLKTAQQQLKVYRQAVLKYAFEGKLTNPDVKEGELPEGWAKATFQDVSTKIGDIDHKMPSKVENGVFPYLSTGDITDENKLDFDRCKLISKDDFLRLSKKIKPQKGDIIFPRYGTIGRNVLVQTEIDFLVSYSCAIIKPDNSKIDSNYFYHYTLSSLTNKEIKKHIVQTTQANVGIASIKSFLITFPESIYEQKKVVQEIESRLSVCDKIEESIEQGLQQAEALRQSILKKAFEGKLVPQDPSDEPASVLLERIKTERQKVQPEKKIKTKKVKA